MTWHFSNLRRVVMRKNGTSRVFAATDYYYLVSYYTNKIINTTAFRTAGDQQSSMSIKRSYRRCPGRCPCPDSWLVDLPCVCEQFPWSTCWDSLALCQSLLSSPSRSNHFTLFSWIAWSVTADRPVVFWKVGCALTSGKSSFSLRIHFHSVLLYSDAQFSSSFASVGFITINTLMTYLLFFAYL